MTRIGALGLSTGAEVVLETAARDPRIRAVVAEGAQARSYSELRKLPALRGVPIVFLTTESDPGMKQQAKAAGATGWITKPFQQAQLIALAHKVLGA